MTQQRVLVVDDSPLALAVTQSALESGGFVVATARDLAELEMHCEGELPDLILMDVQMPELFGDDVAMALRHIRGFQVPIYLLSSQSPEELAQRSHDAGIDGYLCKNDGPDRLLASVKAILAEVAAP